MAMSKMEQQKVYNIVKDHLLTQGERAVRTEDDTCLYRFKKTYPGAERVEKTLKCAAGALIADEAYCPAMEKTTITREGPQGDLLRAAVRYSLYTYHSIDIDPNPRGMDIELIRNLQIIHDTQEDVTAWPGLLAAFAQRHSLVP